MRTDWNRWMTRLAVLMILAGSIVPAARAASDSAMSPEFTVDTRDYILTVVSAHGSTDPAAGEHAYAWRSRVTCTSEAEVTEDGTPWICTGWTGTGSVPPSGTDTTTGEIMLTTLESSVTWLWKVAGHAVSYTVAAHGWIDGNSPQLVEDGGDALPVTALADPEYVFERWTRDGVLYSEANPLTVTDVTAPMTLVAEFRPALPVNPAGPFVVILPPEAFAGGASIWALTGHYESDVGTDQLQLDLAHDSKGKITGMGQYMTDLNGKALYSVPLQAKGGAKGKGGAVLVKLGLKGGKVGIPGDPLAKVKVAIKEALTLDAEAKTLAGSASVGTAFGKVKEKTTTHVSMGLPADMDGTYDLTLDLDYDGKKKVSGTGMLHLSNGAEYLLTIKGKVAGDVTSLGIAGDKRADPAGAGIKLKALVETLEDGSARVLSLSGKAFGQSLAWKP